ncbi:hypothetical protein, partial [[Mycoplasma] collis]|uniref:hypothetical protein n=1 Tax=[Mycoplasma] collis TaxID=2127 RepID=UPI00051BD4B7
MEIKNRIGILDRKMRVIYENCDEKNWFIWTQKAYQSIYGFEFQGDNLFIARVNLFLSFNDYYFQKFKKFPSLGKQKKIANIISWNFWQMDGLKYIIPFSCDKKNSQISLFNDKDEYEKCNACVKKNNNKHIGIYSKIKNWNSKKKCVFEFVKLIK